MPRFALLALLPLTFGCIGGSGPDDSGASDDSGATDDSATDDTGAVNTVVFSQTGGCSDVGFYALNAEGTFLLEFSHAGNIEQAYADGAMVTESFTLPDAAVFLRLTEGEHLDQIPCNDVMDDNVAITQQWDATAGSATLTVTPTGTDPEPWEMPADGELLLEDIELGGAHSVERLEIAAYVGWFPG